MARADEYASIKRIEENLRTISKEFKRADLKMESKHNTVDNLMGELNTTGKVDKVIHSLELSIKRLDQAQESEFASLMGDTPGYRTIEEGGNSKGSDKKLRQ